MATETKLYNDLTFGQYLAQPAMNQSTLKAGRISMAHLKAAIDTPVIPTDAMKFGTALHCAFLEPELFFSKVVQWTGKARRGKEWDTFSETHKCKTILTPGPYNKVVPMIAALRSDPDIIKWQAATVATEVSAMGTINGVPCKGRTDALTTGPICDLKKIASARIRAAANRPEKLAWHIKSYGYDLQGAMYTELFNTERFIIFFVEDAPPYSTVVVELGHEPLTRARAELYRLLDNYKECCKTGLWPGPFEGEGMITLVELPGDTYDHNDIAITLI